MEDFIDSLFTKKGIIKIVIGAVVAFLLGSFLFGSFRTVDAGEIGIITRFGNVDRVAEAGLTFKIPFIENMVKMEVRVQKEEADSSAATKDLQDVTAKLALNYLIDKETALNIYKSLGVNYKDNIIVPALHESFKAGTAQYTSEELITNRTAVKEKILAAVKERLANYGIVVADLNIVNLSFSESFDAAVEAKAVAQQEVEKAKQDLEKAKIEAEKKKTEAQAEAEAQRLQQQTLTDLMIKKMYIEKWDGKLPTTNAGGSGLIIDLK